MHVAATLSEVFECVTPFKHASGPGEVQNIPMEMWTEPISPDDRALWHTAPVDLIGSLLPCS